MKSNMMECFVIRKSVIDELKKEADPYIGTDTGTALWKAIRIIQSGIISNEVAPDPACNIRGRKRVATDFIQCCDLLLAETLAQIDAQGSVVLSVTQYGHQYTIFFLTEVECG